MCHTFEFEFAVKKVIIIFPRPQTITSTLRPGKRDPTRAQPRLVFANGFGGNGYGLQTGQSAQPLFCRSSTGKPL